MLTWRSSWRVVTCVWVALTIAMLLIDYIGVRVVDCDLLAFKVHGQWMAMTFFVAMAAFWWSLYISGGREPSSGVWKGTLLLAWAWWLSTTWLLMGFHQAIGGKLRL